MRTSRKTVSTLAVALAVAVGLAACGSSSSSSPAGSTAASSTNSSGQASSGGIAYAKAQVAKYKALPQFKLSGAQPINVKKLSGKSIEVVPISSAIPYVVGTDDQFQAIGKSLGIKVNVYTNQGTVSAWQQGIEQGISTHASAIDLFAVDPTQVIPQLKDAKAAHIPVIVQHVTEDGQTPPASVKGLYAAQVTTPFNQTGRLSVDYAVSQSGTKTDALIINSAEFPPSNGIVSAIKSEFGKTCPSCKFTVVNVPIADWATQIQSTVQSQLSSDPNINWVIPLYDSESQFAAAGITAAGKTGQVHIASYNGTPFVLKLIESGNVVAMDSAENTNWLGYAGMDATFRVLLGAPPIAEHTPLRIIDKSNVAQTGTPPQVGKGLGTAYLAGYRKLWGLG